MYLRAGIFFLGLLLLSRLLGLARESVQAAAFGSTGMADVVIVMFTLPDLLVGIFLSGALAYVLLPYWAGQSVAEQNVSQKKVALKLLASGLLLSLVIWCLQDPLAQALAPGPNVWIWTGLSSGLLLLLLLPLVGRSIASQGGEGALANFNYAWKLVELPLVLAVQLVAGLAFSTIPRTAAGSPEREKALQLAFSLAWALACSAVAVVVTFSLPLATLLFGWGRKLSTQARELARHYECVAVSFNRRLSTVLASIGRDQLRVLAQQAEQRRRVFERYVLVFAVLPQIHWVPQSDGYRFTRWLTCLTLSGPDVDQRCHQFTKALKRHLIEARPV